MLLYFSIRNPFLFKFLSSLAYSKVSDKMSYKNIYFSFIINIEMKSALTKFIQIL